MRVFIKIASRISVSTSLCMLVLVLSLVSCKRKVDNIDHYDSNELTLTATKPVPIENGNFAPSRSSIEEFTTGSAVGLFVQLRSESENGSTVVMKGNALYRYDQPVWQPDSREDKLMYHESQPVYIFGYYPHPSMQGATTTINEGSSIVDFTLPKDQSVGDDLKTADLLWVGAKNEGQGYLRQRQPINLQFQHKLCKVSFYVKLIDSKPDANSESRVNLLSMATIGSQITSKAYLNVLQGVIIPQYGSGHFDSVRWESPLTHGVELIVGSPAVHVTDLLLIPFVAVESQNWFRYVIHYPLSNVDQSFTAKIPEYDPSAVAGASLLCFESNKHNKVTVTIDVSSTYASLSASIEPWGIGQESDLPAEPE